MLEQPDLFLSWFRTTRVKRKHLAPEKRQEPGPHRADAAKRDCFEPDGNEVGQENRPLQDSNERGHGSLQSHHHPRLPADQTHTLGYIAEAYKYPLPRSGSGHTFCGTPCVRARPANAEHSGASL